MQARPYSFFMSPGDPVSIVSNTGKNSVNDLVTNGVYNEHFTVLRRQSDQKGYTCFSAEIDNPERERGISSKVDYTWLSDCQKAPALPEDRQWFFSCR
jgi:hypothetical protein